MEKKQKLLIALLAVAGLGAGSFYYFTREPATEQATVLEPGAGRKERAKPSEAPKTVARKERTEKAAAPMEAPTRKERTERKEEVSGRKTRAKTNTEVTKKKKLAPAA